MAFRSNEIKVGIVVVGAVVVLVLGLIAVGAVGLGRETDQYSARFGNIGGLEQGSTVRYGGYTVGTVKTVRIAPDEPTKLDLLIDIEKGTPVKVDSLALISQIGFIGDLYLEIKPGTAEAALLPPGARIPSLEAASFSDLMTQVQPVMGDARRLINTLNRTVETIGPQASRLMTDLDAVVSEKNRRRLAAILRDASEMIHRVGPDVEALVTNLRRGSERLDPLLRQANQLAADLRSTRAKVDGLLENVDGMIGENRENIRHTIVRLQQTMTRAQTLINNINRIVSVNQDYIDDMLRNFSEASDNLRQFSDALAAKPSSVVFSNTRKPRKLQGQKTLKKLSPSTKP